jgi:prophage regulatory protein
MSNESKNNQPFLCSAAMLAMRLGVSTRHVWRMNAENKMPAPVRLGGCVRWRTEEVEAWIKAGAPSRLEWDAKKGGR